MKADVYLILKTDEVLNITDFKSFKLEYENEIGMSNARYVYNLYVVLKDNTRYLIKTYKPTQGEEVPTLKSIAEFLLGAIYDAGKGQVVIIDSDVIPC